MIIRPEAPNDIETIHTLTKAAFDPMPFSDGTEADCIKKLRADGDLRVSLVAINFGKLVGHIAFSPVTVDGASGKWQGLGPVAVWPDMQKEGIGSALVNEGLRLIRTAGTTGCVLIGDPKYYGRFGFMNDGRISYRDLPSEYVQWLSFGNEKPSGTIKYSPGLE